MVLSCCDAGRVEAESVESISAVTLVTLNMANAVAFYEALGFRVLYGGADEQFTSFRVGEGYLNLELRSDGGVSGLVWGRVIFLVVDVDAMYDRSLAAGFTPATSPSDAAFAARAQGFLSP